MPLVKLYNMDCLAAMREMRDNTFDLCITDPPYGINAANMTMGGNHDKNGKAVGISKNKKIKGRLNQGAGKLKDRAIQTMNCDWDMEIPSDEYFEQLFRISKNQVICGGNYFPLPPARGIGCWDKIQYWDNFSQWEMIWTSFDCPAWMFRQATSGSSPEKEEKIHATQKPVNLIKYIINKFAKEGDLLIDTHSGSMTSAIAAINMGNDISIYPNFNR